MASFEDIKKKINAPSNILSEENLDKLFALTEEVNYNQGETIVRLGGLDDNLYICKEGVFRGFFFQNDKEVTLYFGVEGDIIASFAPFYKGEPSAIIIEPCGDTTMLRISKANLMKLISEDLEIANWLVDKCFSQFYWLERKSTIVTGDAQEKYSNLLRNRPELFQRVPLKTISSYLGITRQSLSRLRNPNYTKNSNPKK
ncbi:Crp/Fnr family transcriptional regulator [Bacteroidales bacterium OttesenSCG-928-I14]|nr:Crp/Fnr family transcriptional regulator [Bacteroidales bacterium OttesenSCG-928-I14]